MRWRVLILSSLLVLASSSGLFALDTFRCGSKIVALGDSSERVLIDCGEPSRREIINPGYVGGGRTENWFFNCGSDGFLYVLGLVNGELQRIEIEGYGSGRSDCTGAANRNP